MSDIPELRRILYVEDDAAIRAVAKVALEVVGGFEVRLCESGEEAVEAAIAFRPNLCLIDMMMPGMDGLATMAALGAHPATATMPVLFMTAKVFSGHSERYQESGAIGVIPKPFNTLTLSSEIRELWLRYHRARAARAEQG